MFSNCAQYSTRNNRIKKPNCRYTPYNQKLRRKVSKPQRLIPFRGPDPFVEDPCMVYDKNPQDPSRNIQFFLRPHAIASPPWKVYPPQYFSPSRHAQNILDKKRAQMFYLLQQWPKTQDVTVLSALCPFQNDF